MPVLPFKIPEGVLDRLSNAPSTVVMSSAVAAAAPSTLPLPQPQHQEKETSTTTSNPKPVIASLASRPRALPKPSAASEAWRERGGDILLDDEIQLGGGSSSDTEGSATSSLSASSSVQLETGEELLSDREREKRTRRRRAREKRERDHINRDFNLIEAAANDLEVEEGSSSSEDTSLGSSDSERDEDDEEEEEGDSPTSLGGGFGISSRPHRFRSIYIERHLYRPADGTLPVHHALLGFLPPSNARSSSRLSLHGPCALLGNLGGSGKYTLLLGGYDLSANADHGVVLRSTSEEAVLEVVPKVVVSSAGQQQDQQLKKRSTESAGHSHASWREALEALRVSAAAEKSEGGQQGPDMSPLQGLRYPLPSSDHDEDEVPAEAFGAIDWHWVNAVVVSWKQYFAHRGVLLPSMVLALYPYNERHPTGAQRFYLSSNTSTKKTSSGPKKKHRRLDPNSREDAYEEVPVFISRNRLPSVDASQVAALMPSITLGMRRAGSGGGCCIAVVGNANTGKTTLLQYLANRLLSIGGIGVHGVLWLDVDMGQPLYGLPGEVSLSVVHRPTYSSCSPSSTHILCRFFTGSTTVSCPITTANAIARACSVVRSIQEAQPRRWAVVVNTHGWVHALGRRATTEVLQRLSVTHVIHLARPGEEEMWTRSTTTTAMTSSLEEREGDEEPFWTRAAEGLNGAVIKRSFLLRVPVPDANRGTAGPTSAHGVKVLARLPPASATAMGGSSPAVQDTESKSNRDKTQQRAAVHVLPVRWESSPALKKGLSWRRSRWLSYLHPLIDFYHSESEGEPTTTTAPAKSSMTTLLQIPIEDLPLRVALAGEDDRPARGEGVGDVGRLAAKLEHAVVAVQFGLAGVRSSSHLALANHTAGFVCDCYGYVESTERELLGMGQPLRVRVPLSPDEVRERSGEELAVVIGYSPALRAETKFMEEYA